MTRADVVQRVMLECECIWPGSQQFDVLTVEDIDEIHEVLRDALADLREQVEQET